MNVANSLVRYARLLDQQEMILKKGADFKALCEGLVSFRNIRKICARVDFNNGDFNQDFRYHNHPCEIGTSVQDDSYADTHDWYSRRSNSEFGLTVPPAKWYPWLWFVDREYRFKMEFRVSDVRGMQSLFRAISEHCPRLEKLRIGSVGSQAPMTVFQMIGTDTERLRNTFRCLTTLKLHLKITKTKYGPEYENLHHCLDLVLREAKNLRSLSLSGYYPDEELDDPHTGPMFLKPSHCFGFDLLLGKQRPHLTKLSLKKAWVDAESLISILRAHRVSLRDLRLVDLALGDDESWEHLTKEMGQFLRLDCVQVYRLTDDEFGVKIGRWLREDLGPVLVRHIMQWVSPSLLEIEERNGQAIGKVQVGAP